jgi:hypothetical protein
VHRGASIKPRDIFDIAAAGEYHAERIIAALKPYRVQVEHAIKRLDRLNPEFVRSAISELQIREKFGRLRETATRRARELLGAV